MAAIRNEIEIDAPANTVWTVFTTFSEYENWNPFIVRAGGSFREQRSNEVVIALPNGGEQRFTPEVVEVVEGKRLVWESGTPGIFKRRISFDIEDLGDGKSRFVHSAEFTGLMTMFKGSTIKALEEGYDRMNEALKERAEGMTRRQQAGQA